VSEVAVALYEVTLSILADFAEEPVHEAKTVSTEEISKSDTAG
jgi:hypothetical protein